MVAVGDPIRAADFAGAGHDENGTNVSGLSNTSAAIPTGQTCGFTFTAPTSGAVVVIGTILGEINDGADDNDALHWSPAVRTGSTIGSGTLQYTPSTDEGGRAGDRLAAGDQAFGSAVTAVVTGLTPGDTYNAYMTAWVDNGTSSYDIFGQTILSMPLHI